MKQRFSSLDVRAISHELNQTLAGSRLSNVYDLVPPSANAPSSSSSQAAAAAAAAASSAASRAILLRFARSQEKHQLIVDPGFRCHLTAYDARASSGTSGPSAHSAPSAFVTRLRSLISGRHVTGVSQLGTDRVIEIRFSDGQLRLYLEFFAAGNVVLTDDHAKILALKRTVAAFRSVSLEKTLNVGNPYALAKKRIDEGDEEHDVPLTLERLKAVLEAEVAADRAAEAAAEGEPPKKKKKAKGLSRILALNFTDLSQALIDHCILCDGFDATPANAQPADLLAEEPRLDALFKVLQDARTMANGFFTADKAQCKGYIIATKREGATVTAEDGEGAASQEVAKEDLDYVDFHPFSPRQFETDPKYVILPFDSFNKAADEFYYHLQGIKAHRQLHQQESFASKKLEATKRDQAARIESLKEAQQLNVRKAGALTANQDWVQLAIDAVNENLQDGMDWEDLAVLIGDSAEENPVAALIKLPMRLSEGIITLKLEEEPDDYADGEEEQGDDADGETKKKDTKTIEVDVKLALSAWGNAREYYDQKRIAAVKEQKTKEVTSMALRNAEKKVAEELKRVQKGGKPAPQQLIRRQMWFEKFLWFISSDGYLVIAAREFQQCEIVYRRHLRRGDVFVHANIKGSPGIIVVKNRFGAQPDDPIPPTTLAQAGCLAVCASEAWETKAGLGAYWVRADQVFKTTRTGDVLPPGSFDVRGEKNHLPPPQRVLGFGLLFKVNNASTPEHLKNGVEDGVKQEGEVEAQREKSTEEKHEEGEQTSQEAPAAKSVAGEEQENGHTRTDEEANAAEPEEKEEAAEPEPADEDDEQGKKQEDETEEQQEEEANEDTQAASWKGKGKEALRSRSPAPSITSTAATKSGPATKRGQKAKAKKMAKYKDQDDEDRARVERLNGIAAGREKAEAKAKAKAKREAELAAYEERRRAQRERQMQATKAYEEARQAKLANGGDDNDGGDADGDDLEILSTLVGRASAGDEILEAVPVCAPWTALSRLKYKVKMQPGSTKKGRAMRDVLERWKHVAEAATGTAGNSNSILDENNRDPERMWPREVELIRGIKMEEAANCVPVGKVTLMMAGGFGGGGGGSGGGKNGKQSGAGGKKGGAGGKGGGKKK